MRFIKAKSILTANGGRGMNAFRGCTHGCIYCDARSECYQIPKPFENVIVKENAVELLENALSRKRKKCMIGTGAMCDPYIPAEKNLCITRQCLEIILRHGFGATVHTKSTLVLRDFDLLREINRRTKAVLQMTLTTFDESLCRKIEPNVATTRERFEVLLKAHEFGIPSVVWISPILPFINDTAENLRGILNFCKEANVKAIMCFGFGLTLRSGNREYFYERLDKDFPGLSQKYKKVYGDSYEVTSKNNLQLMKILEDFCRKEKIIFGVERVFSYVNAFEEKEIQGSLF